MSSLTVEEEDQKWEPTHVQVTVLKGRGLRGKGKHGTSDVYTIIQLGKEKYSTGVAEKTTEPEWREECSFELLPGALERGGSNELVLTVMHRALIGLDVFLGQAVIQLDKLFHESRYVKNEWYRLNSKTGKKEKERGDIQVTIQFTRNNLTASMYDLVMKDKGASTFSKLKERMKGKRRSSDDDSSSAVVQGGYSTLHRMRHRLPSDGGGEEDYEDDEGGEVRRSKMRTFFLRGKLRKSSDTRSSTSLGSESSESSSRGGSLSPTAGISVVVSDLSNSPSNSSNLTADNSPEHTANTSPKSSSLRCDYGDEAGEITIAVPTVCVNGSHAYKNQAQDRGSGKSAGTLGLGLLQKSMPHSVSLQNLSTRPFTDLPKGPGGDGRRWSFDRAGEEEKAAIAAALEKSGPMLGEEEERPEQASLPKASKAESENQVKKQRKNLFSHGRSESAGKGQSQSKDVSEQISAATEERHRAWFGSKESHNKPSSRPPITDLFPKSSDSNLTQDDASVGATDTTMEAKGKLEKRPLPPIPLEREKPLIEKSANPFMSADELELGSQWEESFEALAAGRLQSPEDLTMEYRTQQNTVSDHPLEHDHNKGELQSHPDADDRTNVNDTLYHPPGGRFFSNALSVPSQLKNSNTHIIDTFPPFLETIPEQRSFESDDSTLNTPTNSPELWDFQVAAQDKNIPNDFSDTNVNKAPFNISSAQINENNSSPDPSSSGLGSSTEEDGLSCFSSQSEKFSAVSSEEAEGNIPRIKTPSDSAVVENVKTSESGDSLNDRSGNQPLLDDANQTVIQQEESPGQKVVFDFLDESLQTPPPTLMASEQEAESEHEDNQTPKTFSMSPDLLSTLQPTSPLPQQSTDGLKEESTDLTVEPSDEFNPFSKNSTEGVIPGSPEDEFSSTLPSVHVTTSSPDVKHDSSDLTIEKTSSEGQEANSYAHVDLGIFDNFLNISRIASTPEQDSTLLPVQSDYSSNSLLHSHYFSTDSQDYLTCDSQPLSKWSSFSELNETLFSANSTLCVEMSDVKTDPVEPLGTDNTSLSQTSNFEINQNKTFEESLFGDQGKAVDLESSLTVGDGLQGLLAPLPGMSYNPQILSEVGEENQDDFLLKCPEGQHATLQRSHSEGTLTPAIEQQLLPSFGSDPCTIQESFLAQPGPNFPSPNPFAPSLTPESSSFHVALPTHPPLATVSATVPPSSAQGAVPNPDVTEQLQAANPPCSPHPVKPLTTAMVAEEKRSVLATGLEKLKSTIHPGRSSQITEHEADNKKSLTEGAGSYYHLTHSELVALLVQREAELERQKAEFERQKLLLAKREVELKKLKPQVRDLEDYIDTLLVRIMEQKPTLLQVRSKLK